MIRQRPEQLAGPLDPIDAPVDRRHDGPRGALDQPIHALARAGKTVFYCSHVMDVVERVCDRIAILDGGKLVALGTFEELQQRQGGGSLERIFAALTSEGGQTEKAQALVDALRSG